MARPVIILSLLMLAAPPAAGQSVSSIKAWRIVEMTPPAPEDSFAPSIDVSSTGRFGIGMFGWKPEKGRASAITVREMNEPRSRRPGVGFSLKF